MNNLFKKYGKIVLAIASVLLMFLWLNPAKNSGGGVRENVEIGRLGGKKVMSYDLIGAQNILMTIQAMPDYMHPPYAEIPFLEFPNILNKRDPALHLFLLLKEAEKYGISVTGDEISQEIHNSPVKLEDFDVVFQKVGIAPTELYNVVTAYLKIQKLQALTGSALRPSLPEIEHLGADIYSRANVRYVTLDATRPGANMAAPTDAEIEAQFKAYKDIVPTGEPPEVEGHHFPFAYKYADRVRVEYLTFEHEKVKGLVAAAMTPEQAREDQRAAYHYYEAHPDEFAATTQTAAGAAAGAVPYEQVSGKLVDRVLNDRALKLGRQMAEEAVKIAGEPWKTIDAEGFHEAVPRKDWVSYASIADTIAGERRFLKYRPEVSGESGWADKNELNQMPGIGDAVLPTQQGTGYLFSALALHVKEITREAKEPVFRLLQVGVEGPILMDERGNLYVYRVTDAQQSHTPGSAAEVRGQVVEDILRRKKFEAITKEAEGLAADAKTRGLGAVAVTNALAMASTGDFTRMTAQATQWGVKEVTPTPIAGLGVVPELSDAVFRLAQGGGAGGAGGDATRPGGAGEGSGEKAASVPVDNRLQVFVIELADFQPMGRGEFDSATVKSELIGIAQFNSQMTFARKWRTLSSAAERVDFVPGKGTTIED